MFGKKKSNPPEWLIAGLGNPGKKYELTRHNAGFICIDKLAEKYGVKINKLSFNALTANCRIGDSDCLLMKPQTFMNNSGEAVSAAAEKYNIPSERIIVISDDISFNVGTLRIRRNGSSGGQNGLNNIILMLDTQNFPRIKVGVGKRPESIPTVDWVLSEFVVDEIAKIKEVAENVGMAVEEIISADVDSAMGKYNKTV